VFGTRETTSWEVFGGNITDGALTEEKTEKAQKWLKGAEQELKGKMPQTEDAGL